MEYKIKQIPEDFIVKETSDLIMSDDGEYLIFNMKKKNYTTEKAVQAIADALHINRKRIGYAGSKDSRAITEQMISLHGCSKEQLQRLSLKDIELSFAGKSAQPISLGDHTGNSFEITARSIEKAPRRIEKTINYYGEQRFSTNNVEIGKAILKKQYKEAVQLIIEHKGRDEEVIKEFLQKNPTDYVGALKRTPWKILNMYIHAYQSKIWNLAAKIISESQTQTRNAPISLPVVGFATEYEDAALKELMEKILIKDQVSSKDFVIRAIPELTSAGTTRDLFLVPKNLAMGELEDDELNPGKKKIRISFTLGKGSYATEILKAMFS